MYAVDANFKASLVDSLSGVSTSRNFNVRLSCSTFELQFSGSGTFGETISLHGQSTYSADLTGGSVTIAAYYSFSSASDDAGNSTTVTDGSKTVTATVY